MNAKITKRERDTSEGWGEASKGFTMAEYEKQRADRRKREKPEIKKHLANLFAEIQYLHEKIAKLLLRL